MIETLAALPALTDSWLAPLKQSDPELYAELAESLVVHASKTIIAEKLPADVTTVLEAIDLAGKEIGAFRFAPAAGVGMIAQIRAYDRTIRRQFDAPDDLTFIGDYGAGSVFAAPQGIGLFDTVGDRITILAARFEPFVLVQANAYASYKRHIVKKNDAASYNKDCDEVAACPEFVDVDVVEIYEAQLKA